MLKSLSNVLPWPNSGKRAEETDAETTPGGNESVRWVEVAVNLNPAEAAIIRARLDSHNIPALAQQEAIGSVFGLTVGPLGSAKVLVPEPLAEQALEILAEIFELDEEFDDKDFDVDTYHDQVD